MTTYDDWKTRLPRDDTEDDLLVCPHCGDDYHAEWILEADEDGAFRRPLHEQCGACDELEAMQIERAAAVGRRSRP